MDPLPLTSSSKPRNIRRVCTVLFLGTFAITILWTLKSRLPEHLLQRLPFPSPSSPAREELTNIVVNNNVTYPRLNAQPQLSQREAQLLHDRLTALYKDKVIFQPQEDRLEKFNWREMDRLKEYLSLAKRSGHLARPRVILSSWHWVPCSYDPECTPGEALWMRSLLQIMQHHDIFFLFSNWRTLRRDWRLLGNDLVTHIWADDRQVLWCFNDSEGCIQSSVNLRGIPPHKLFAFTFWGATQGGGPWHGSPSRPWSFNPLGSEWSLVPYEMPEGHFHLGYHYERCGSLPFIPHSQRKDQIVVLAKESRYFYESPVYDPATFYVDLRRRTGMNIITNAKVWEGFPIPDGLTSMGPVSVEEYDTLLADSKAVLGMGRPILSPTPYTSLCRGVPVIIPFKSLLPDGRQCSGAPPSDDWCGFDMVSHQHGPIGRVGEPMVYTVDVNGPVEDVYQAIQRAVNTPVGQYEPPEMRYENVQQRLLDYLEVDWEVFAQGKQRRGTVPNNLSIEDWQRDWIKRNPDSEISPLE